MLDIARDLTASLAATDRYARLIDAVKRAIPCDAACLLRLDGTQLVPVSAHGLVPEALARTYDRAEHPRLDAILGASEPVYFPPTSTLPDPFDGLLEAAHAGGASAEHTAAGGPADVHACLGCALRDGGEVVGALTADALDPHAFDALDPAFVATLGALAGAAMRTTALIEALERRAEHRWRVARELQQETAGTSLLGVSPAARRLRDEIALVAGSDLAVLVTGETGVGKELVARYVHGASPRREEGRIHVICGALPEVIA
jgi:anaerobic nitric oxide reductase transcription regulator